MSEPGSSIPYSRKVSHTKGGVPSASGPSVHTAMSVVTAASVKYSALTTTTQLVK